MAIVEIAQINKSSLESMILVSAKGFETNKFENSYVRKKALERKAMATLCVS